MNENLDLSTETQEKRKMPKEIRDGAIPSIHRFLAVHSFLFSYDVEFESISINGITSQYIFLNHMLTFYAYLSTDIIVNVDI